MAKKDNAVIILSNKGDFVAKYPSIDDVAKVYNCTTSCVRKYIESGNLWKAKKVFLDLAL